MSSLKEHLQKTEDAMFPWIAHLKEHAMSCGVVGQEKIMFSKIMFVWCREGEEQ